MAPLCPARTHHRGTAARANTAGLLCSITPVAGVRDAGQAPLNVGALSPDRLDSLISQPDFVGPAPRPVLSLPSSHLPLIMAISFRPESVSLPDASDRLSVMMIHSCIGRLAGIVS